MEIRVPTQEEARKEKKKKWFNFALGIILGFIFFGLVGMRIFVYGFDAVSLLSWVCLSFGVLSFGLLAYRFGESFWDIILKK